MGNKKESNVQKKEKLPVKRLTISFGINGIIILGFQDNFVFVQKLFLAI